MAMKAKVLGRAALEAKLNSLVPRAREATAKAKLEVAQEAAHQIALAAPRKKGDYARSIKGERLDGAYTFTDSYAQTKDVDATGIFANWIWRFLEFGTAPHKNKGQFAGTDHPGTVPQPHIFPTWRAYRPRALRKVRNALNKAVREAMGKK